jgi:hypothetical protein
VSQTDPTPALGEPTVPVGALRALLRKWEANAREETLKYAHLQEFVNGITLARDACSEDLHDLIARYDPPRQTPLGEA